MADKKSSNTKIMVTVGAVFVVLVAAMLFSYKPVPPPDGVSAPDASSSAAIEQISAEQSSAAEETATNTPPGLPAAFDINEALSDRILGDTNAPLKIVEFASLTCSHCGDFHRETFDKIKANFIDTGKAYVIFTEFPLNAPAMQATKVARCLPKDKYFEFTHMLFKEQATWTVMPDYKGWLKTKAIELGLPPEQFDACINSSQLEQSIATRMKAATSRWDISATPSFVFNDGTTISGAYGYEAFAKLIEEEIAKVKDGVPAERQSGDTPLSPQSVRPSEMPTPAATESAPTPPAE